MKFTIKDKKMNKYKTDTLISMVEYVSTFDLYKYEDPTTCMIDNRSSLIYIKDYADLLSQKPKLADFIPCDEEGSVLEEPKKDSEFVSYENLQEQYQQAKDRVIFDEWEYCKPNNGYWYIERENFRIYFITKTRKEITIFTAEEPFKGKQIATYEDLTQFKLKMK